jgi:hypothetical protein
MNPIVVGFFGGNGEEKGEGGKEAVETCSFPRCKKEKSLEVVPAVAPPRILDSNYLSPADKNL